MTFSVSNRKSTSAFVTGVAGEAHRFFTGVITGVISHSTNGELDGGPSLFKMSVSKATIVVVLSSSALIRLIISAFFKLAYTW